MYMPRAEILGLPKNSASQKWTQSKCWKTDKIPFSSMLPLLCVYSLQILQIIKEGLWPSWAGCPALDKSTVARAVASCPNRLLGPTGAAEKLAWFS